MDIRRLVRGSLDWSELEGVAIELARRLDREEIHITFLETDNWSSIPFVVDQDYFVKVITPQNALVHALFTGARNLGAITSGSQGFFDRFDSPYEMAKHEVQAIQEMRDISMNAPEPVEVFAYGHFGVVVMEFLPEFETLDDIELVERPELQQELFASLAKMHEHGVAHGDLRAENVLLYEGELYFIDATLVSESLLSDAKAYDLASAMAIMSPRIGAKQTIDLATQHFGREALLAARRFLDFVKLRPDHDFDVVQLRGEIDTQVA